MSVALGNRITLSVWCNKRTAAWRPFQAANSLCIVEARWHVDGSSQFDSLTRLLAAPPATRRRVIAGLAAALAASVPVGELAAKKKKRCKRTKRCGKGCCNGESCFATIESGDGPAGKPFCCATASLCKSVNTYPDQCCYPEEICDPQWTNSGAESADGVCYLPCNGTRCNSVQECIDGVCQFIGTVRVPRQRR